MGIEFDLLSLEQVVSIIFLNLNKNQKIFIVTANPEIVVNSRKDSKLKNIIKNADIVTPDGIGIVFAIRLKKNKVKRVSGFDLVKEIFLRVNDCANYNIFLLGSNKKNIKLAKENIEKDYRNIKICGYHDGYFDDENKIIDLINCCQTDILLVGMGSPLQEKFIFDNKKKINAKIFIGVGGTFDILSGNIKRAPILIQNIGLEWLYRIFKQPKRIFRIAFMPKFIFSFLFERFR
ncbi:MAG: WecB/TagA/CpsF family glycosyltransferase [Clostridiales bacterium]|nr:WecB/TagA/CpsF family glycosyltransferase [Clostridiales bacterium]